jgi:hypothetical protein
MIDTVNSGSDPAGKQYRASVAKQADAGNGITIAEGSAATVTLTSSGSGYTAQLSSIAINGQQVAVTSNSASVSAVAQSATNKAASAVGSMLGGFGHHVSAPASVAAAATGQHVFVPTGTTLTFVLGQSPAAGSSQTMTASAGTAPNPASGPAAASAPEPASTASSGGSLTEMLICFSNPPPFASDLNHNKEFLTGVFEIPADARSNVPPDTAFALYLKAAYQYPGAHVTCQPIWTIADAKAVQKKVATDHAPNVKMVDTGWRDGQPPLAQGQSGFDPLTQGPGGLDLSQHRLTTYYCSLTAPGGTSMAEDRSKPNWTADRTTYVSPVFQADWDSDTVSVAYQEFIQDRYVPDLSHLSQAYTNPWCSANNSAMQAMQHQSAMISDKRIGHAVAVDFTYTAAQAAAGNTAAASANTASAGAAAALGPNQSYAFCSSDPGAAVVYFSDIFASSTPPNTGHCGNCAAQRNAAYATSAPFQTFLKEKYGFNGSASCRTGIPPTAAGLKAAQDQKQSSKTAIAGHSRAQIVETGWKNQ